MPDDDQLENLRERLPDDFSVQMLKGSLLVLSQPDNAMRAHQFASTHRELIAHVLEAMAPTADVIRCSWFKQAEDVDGPTRRQRALYTCRGGLPDSFLKEKLKLDPRHLHADFGNAFQELNKRVHVRPDTVLSDADEIEEFADNVVASLNGVFDTIDDVRNTVIDAIARELHGEAMSAFIEQTIDELGEISGHYTVDIVWIDEAEVLSLDADTIKYLVRGNVEVTLLYGSSSDRAKDNGAEIDESFPYECRTVAPASDPTKFDSAETEMKVDTRGWFGEEQESA
jgi:hypothetical protein